MLVGTYLDNYFLFAWYIILFILRKVLAIHTISDFSLLFVTVSDASGKYSSQFFFGNDMWVGSISLCGELADPDTNSEIPPFEVGFFAAKVRININEMLTPVVSKP